MNIAQKIPLKKLNLTDQSIPQIGFGTYELKGEECFDSVLHALNVGYRHIDTASIYKNEEFVGKAVHQFLQENKESVERKDIFITSKISPQEQGYEKATVAVKNILGRLNLTYLDLILIHWPGTKKVKPENTQNIENRQQTWKAFIELKQQKLVKNIGVSNFLERHIESLKKINGEQENEIPVINQFELHPLLLNQKLVDYCQKNKIQVEAYSSLARQDEKLMKSEIIEKIAQKYQKSTSQVSLRWSIQKQNVVIPKSKTQKYIEQNFNIFDFNLEEEEIKQIDSLDSDHHTCWDPSIVV